MTKSIRHAFIQIWLWKKDLRAILAIALGIGIICYEGYPYLKYAAFVRSNIQACELYILCGSTGYIYLGLFLGYLLLMSNAPFIDRMASFEIVRFGRKRWIDSKILYIILGCFILLIIIMILRKRKRYHKRYWKTTIKMIKLLQNRKRELWKK